MLSAMARIFGGLALTALGFALMMRFGEQYGALVVMPGLLMVIGGVLISHGDEAPDER